jgi:hypothetical protein
MDQPNDDKVVPCLHPRRYCGDALILNKWPDFYETHEQPGDGQEWQVCAQCEDAKLVQIFPPGELAVSFRAPIQPRDHLVATASVAHAGVSANGQSAAVAVQEWPKPAPVDELMAELKAVPNALSDEESRKFAEYLSSHTPEELVAANSAAPYYDLETTLYDASGRIVGEKVFLSRGKPTGPLLAADAPDVAESAEIAGEIEEPPLEKQLAEAIHSLAVAESGRLELWDENARLKGAMARLQARIRVFEIDSEIADLEGEKSDLVDEWSL